ncbi:MAG TPA: flagellar hook-associated protein FlgK [Kofleriaceae bacterium]|jgi:flagellar hook-associated protein 1 FlgK|nr:flagellar hook-associated protein FlgK [Kofleriaceae bacterium]
MTSLLSLLSVGASAVSAQNAGVAIAANNIANANTDGYSQQRVDFESLPAAPLIGGVRTGNPTRMQDNLLAKQIQTAAGSLAMSQSFSDGVSQLETAVSGGGPTVDEQLGTLFSSISAASASPTDASLRGAVITAAGNLATGIQRRAADVATTRSDADVRIRAAAVSATTLANQLAAANVAVAKTGDPAQLDHRDQLAKQLGQLVGGQARIDSDGQMRYVLDGGAVLVDGSHAATLAATADPTTGFADLAVVNGSTSRDVTAAIGGGSIGAALKLRDQTGAQAASQLDQVAYDLATSVNAVHTANAGLDGVSGRPMFTPPTQVAGAASTIAVDPALAANSQLLALAAPSTGPGNNTGALALFALGTRTVASGGTRTLGDAAIDVVANVANASSEAKSDATRDGLVSDHLAGLRDSLAGVDTQEQLTDLARFEQASNAMAKVVSTINDMLGSLITNL